MYKFLLANNDNIPSLEKICNEMKASEPPSFNSPLIPQSYEKEYVDMKASQPQSLISPIIPQSYDNDKVAKFNGRRKDAFQDLLYRFSKINIAHRETVDKDDIFNFINSRLFFVPTTAIWSLIWFTYSLFDQRSPIVII